MMAEISLGYKITNVPKTSLNLLFIRNRVKSLKSNNNEAGLIIKYATSLPQRPEYDNIEQGDVEGLQH